MIRSIFTVFWAVVLIRYYVLSEDAGTMMKCSCAVMNGTSTEPLLVHDFPNKLGCDEKSTEGCKKLCITITQATKESGDGPELLCQELMMNTSVQVTVHSKICDGAYVPTGLAYENYVCCFNGSVCKVKEEEPKLSQD